MRQPGQFAPLRVGDRAPAPTLLILGQVARRPGVEAKPLPLAVLNAHEMWRSKWAGDDRMR
jgi:hypothetical protein